MNDQYRRTKDQRSFKPQARNEEPRGGRCRFGICRLVLLWSLVLGAWPFAANAAPRPNFLFLLADDLRPDCIRALGHPVIETPNLDALAHEGTVFPRAVAAYPICHVSRAEMLSGTSAFRNGVQYRGAAIDPALKTWAGTLRAAGYHTWFSGKWHNDGQPKSRGYEATGGLYSSGGASKERLAQKYLDHAGRPATGYTGWTFKTDDGKVELEKGIGLTPITDRHIADGAISLIRRKPAEPFFLHVNFTAPHDPRFFPPGHEKRYDPAKLPLPPSYRAQHPFDHGNLTGRDEVLLTKPLVESEFRAELAAYYAEISHLDEQVGRIVAALRETGQLENTVIIFSSDQGLAMGSHGLTGKQNLYEHTFRVPLVFRGPGVPRGQTNFADCYLRDLFPTTCELAGVAIPDTVQSRSLAPLFSGKAKFIHDFVVGYYTDTQRAIRDGDWKLICYPKAGRWQLFNLESDPDELHDLAVDFNSLGEYEQTVPKFSDLRHKLINWLTQNGDPFAATLAPVRPSFEPEPGKSVVMVFGAGAPVGVPFTAGLTVGQAIRAAQAPAEKGRATVWRLDGRREPLDIAQLAAKKIEDPKLEVGEMVFVTKSK
ncbi:MAG: sulfatase-like hydrolase/transferase [Verrucomicrobia bacterium]|nr:sulfatase-like hydrolase/transferase [Verrucomicrobiota bacterium]